MPSDTHVRAIFSETVIVPANGSIAVKFAWSVPRYLDGFRLYPETANAIRAELVDQSGRVMIGDAPVPVEVLAPQAANLPAQFPGTSAARFVQRAQDGLVWTLHNVTGNPVNCSVAVWTFAFEPDGTRKGGNQTADPAKNARS